MPARPALIARIAPHSRLCNGARKTRAARMSVAGSSRTWIGPTTERSPLPSAVAWSRKPTVMAPIPPNQTGSWASLQMSRGLMFSCCGALRLALRCSTDDSAFAPAARTASTSVSIRPPGRAPLPGPAAALTYGATPPPHNNTPGQPGLSRHRDGGVAAQHVPQLPARGDAELGEHVAHVPFDGAGAEEQLGA